MTTKAVREALSLENWRNLAYSQAARIVQLEAEKAELLAVVREYYFRDSADTWRDCHCRGCEVARPILRAHRRGERK